MDSIIMKSNYSYRAIPWKGHPECKDQILFKALIIGSIGSIAIIGKLRHSGVHFYKF